MERASKVPFNTHVTLEPWKVWHWTQVLKASVKRGRTWPSCLAVGMARWRSKEVGDRVDVFWKRWRMCVWVCVNARVLIYICQFITHSSISFSFCNSSQIYSSPFLLVILLPKQEVVRSLPAFCLTIMAGRVCLHSPDKQSHRTSSSTSSFLPHPFPFFCSLQFYCPTLYITSFPSLPHLWFCHTYPSTPLPVANLVTAFPPL